MAAADPSPSSTARSRAVAHASVALPTSQGWPATNSTSAVVPAGSDVPDDGAAVRVAFDAADLHVMEDQS